MSNQKPIITELDRLAREGKLWSLEVLYTHKQEVKRLQYSNQTNEQIRDLRRAIFSAGFVVPVKDAHGQPVKGSYQIIPPLDIIEVFMHQQSGYFPGC